MINGPPKDTPASELWLKLSAQERPSQIVDFPRKGLDGEPVGQLRIRILTQEELMSSEVAAEKVAREHIKDATRDQLGYEKVYADAVCVEVLFRACRDADDLNRTAFPSPKQLRQALTTEECSVLFKHYLTVQVELGPSKYQCSDEEMEAWITRLAEGGSAYPLDIMSSEMLSLLVLYMAYQLRSSPRDKSSASEPLNEPTESPIVSSEE